MTVDEYSLRLTALRQFELETLKAANAGLRYVRDGFVGMAQATVKQAVPREVPAKAVAPRGRWSVKDRHGLLPDGPSALLFSHINGEPRRTCELIAATGLAGKQVGTGLLALRKRNLIVRQGARGWTRKH